MHDGLDETEHVLGVRVGVDPDLEDEGGKVGVWVDEVFGTRGRSSVDIVPVGDSFAWRSNRETGPPGGRAGGEGCWSSDGRSCKGAKGHASGG